MQILYEDNHIIIVDKEPGEIVQGDRTGDTPLCDALKDYIKERDHKPGNVFIGVVHRLDRPVGGVVIFAKTSKALTRLNDMMRLGATTGEKAVRKTYWALTRNLPPKPEDTLHHWLKPIERNNKTYIARADEPGAKEAVLRYRVIGRTESFTLLEIELITGRKHQIRAQLSAIGCPIRGDLKYGDKRSNPDGSISLLARRVEFIHPVSHEKVSVEAPYPSEWPQIIEYNADTK